MLLEQRADRYLRWPRFAPGPSGLELHLLGWEPGEGERHLSFSVDLAGERLSPLRAGPLEEAIVGFAPGRPPTPTQDAVLASEWAVSGDWSVRIERPGGRSLVFVRTPSGRDVRVWESNATAAAPAVAEAVGGAWVGFHHNLREDDGRIDLAKWITVRFVSCSGEVFEPCRPMRDRDRDLVGEEQSFEFPALSVSPSGSLTLIGRGAHTIFAQTLSGEGWSRRRPLDDGQWGCRGHHLDLWCVDEGTMLAAWRAKRGVEVVRMDTAPAGAPDLKAATVLAEGWVEPPPVLRRGQDPARRSGRVTLFGDIQQHSAHSDGLGAAVEPYLRARHVYADDFCALTDHESFLGKRTSPGEWSFLQQVAQRFDEDGAFSTLVAYEWTGRRYPGPGHKCVYLPGPGFPIVSRDDVPDGADLVQRIKAQGAITGPHHTGWTGADLEGHDPEGQPFFEICSCHGCYEHPDHPLGARGDLEDQLIDAALARGLRFGFIANSDSHGLLWHHGEARKRDPFRTGLTAVQAEARTRSAIFEALRQRRCYATSGVPILLDFVVGEAPMGSAIELRPDAEAVVRVVGTAPIRRVELVSDQGCCAVVSPDDGRGEVELRWRLSKSLRYLYARVTQADEEMAWSSPVFFAG